MSKCRVCKKEFIRLRPLQQVCSLECAIKLSKQKKQKEITKQQREQKRVERARKAELRHKLETKPELTRKAQQAFNRYIRLRDKHQPCISCGKPSTGQTNSIDAGHYRSVGSSPHLRFDERNCHAQCKHCNQYLSGNIVMYRQGLIERIGIKEVEALESDQAERKYTISELRELIAYYKQKAKEFE